MPVVIDYIVRPRLVARGWDAGAHHRVLSGEEIDARQRRAVVIADIATKDEIKRLIESFSSKDKTFQVLGIATSPEEGRPIITWKQFEIAAQADVDPSLKLYNWENIWTKGVPAK